MSSSRQTCEKAGPGSSKTRSSKVPERGQFGSVLWCVTVKVSRVKCHAGNRTIGVTPGPAGFAAAPVGLNVAGTNNRSAATIRATRTDSARLDPPKPFILASPNRPGGRMRVLTLGPIGIRAQDLPRGGEHLSASSCSALEQTTPPLQATLGGDVVTSTPADFPTA